MTKSNKIIYSSLVLYIFAALSMAQAQNVPGLSGAPAQIHSGDRIRQIYSQLNLTDDQKKQLEANKQQHRAKMESARQEMKTYKEAMKGELMRPQLDMPKIMAIHNQIKALQDQTEDDKLNSILAVRTILTTEQFTKFVDLMHKHKEGHEEEQAEHQEHD